MSYPLVLVAVLAVVFAVVIALLIMQDADRKDVATTRRLRSMAAPPPKLGVVAPTDTPKGDPWVKYLPASIRPHVDDALGKAGYKLKLRTLLLVAILGAGLDVSFVSGVMHMSVPIAIFTGIIAALGPTWMLLKNFQNRHMNRFLGMFPDAIDLIVRAVRAGLPVTGALETAGRETPDPVGVEFRLIAADLRIGLDLEEALRRAAARVRLTDFSFFVASLVLQRESGGNLSETLSILSSVLRRRAELRLKIAALISEAKTSAFVIGALPFVSGGALAIIDPDYIKLFATEPAGGYILGLAIAMLSMGFISMRALIQNAVK